MGSCRSQTFGQRRPPSASGSWGNHPQLSTHKFCIVQGRPTRRQEMDPRCGSKSETKVRFDDWKLWSARNQALSFSRWLVEGVASPIDYYFANIAMLKLQIPQGPLMTEQLRESGFHGRPILYGIPHDDGSIAILGLCRYECRDGRIVLANPGVLIDDVDKNLVRLLNAILKATVQESELSFFKAKKFISTDGREQQIKSSIVRLHKVPIAHSFVSHLSKACHTTHRTARWLHHAQGNQKKFGIKHSDRRAYIAMGFIQ